MNDNANEDWLRARTWDLPREPSAFVQLLTGRIDADVDDDDAKAALKHFADLPAAKAAPASIRALLDRATRTA